ncbi:cytochrome c-type biogenesis protein CcmH [Dasania sp. GY-MA-18]|uniref:Cytochrome c-type biogenesis protein n=1 Tax=Dasania phycosphaerae TaxID=2950436 RepID=A0A9J6RHI2_9GAMM|nr:MULTISPECIES: cytochrome c-type biogenesis protein [Dasania]MCR8921698.1 cytochrome c-type biogenesis protein CcmH [Dasania sp. GY-MA-18]MCZ0864126.1 cytochrome c-type biogenesis protein CcmH [Dasania phycosphaerae]MCZ0867854.1 cytochrome c-type biogenesis protein CcmH [Dasania phycosphaerae]
MRLILALSLLLLSLMAAAVIETYQFDNEVLRKRYQHFTEELRCPKCQNQNLSGSNSPIAQDLRRELHRLLHEGYSDQEITHYMVERYGEFVLYRPPVNKQTLILWLAPALFLLLAVIAVVIVIRKQMAAKLNDESEQLSGLEQEKLTELLNDRAKGRDHE